MFHCDVAFVLVFFLSLKVSSSNKLCPRGKKAVGFFLFVFPPWTIAGGNRVQIIMNHLHMW